MEEEEGKEKEEGKTVRGSASNVSFASWIKHEYAGATYQEDTRNLLGILEDHWHRV